jgi:O-antigen/teichoic acid export membrane protein
VLNVVLPGLAVVIALAPVAVPLLGERWREAAPVIQVLAVAALAQAVIGPVGQLMKGLGRPGWLVIWSIGFTLVTSVALWIGVPWGLLGTSIGYVVAHVAAIPVILWIGWRLTGLGPVGLVAISWRPLVAAAALGAGLSFAVRHTAAWNRPALAVGALALGALYLVVLARLNPEFTGLVMRELEKLRPSAQEPAAVAGPPPLG